MKIKKWKIAEGQAFTSTQSMGKVVHSDKLHCTNHTAAAIAVLKLR